MYRQRLTASRRWIYKQDSTHHPCIGDYLLNKEHCIGDYLFAKNVRKLVSQSGLLFKALYLKQASDSLQMAYAGVLMIDY